LIEYALFFGIGFLVALFAAVAATPIFSRRAMRLALARVRMQTPTTDKLAAAAADSLLATHAVELVRLEHRVAAAQHDAMDLRVKVGRQSVQISALESDVAERDGVIFEMRSELDKRAAECRNLESAMAASQVALRDAFAQRDRAENSEAADRLGELEAEASRDRARIAILVAQVENLGELLRHAEAAKDHAAKSVAELSGALARERSRGAELERQLRTLTRERQASTESSARAEARLEEGRRRLAELESRIQQSEGAREELLIENARQLAALADRESALRAAQAKADELESRFAVGDEARPSESSGAERLQRMPGEPASAGSRKAARANAKALLRENEILRSKISALVGAHNQADDVALRTSIERLGREVSRLYARQRNIDKEANAPRERTSSGRQDAAAIAAPANAETHELVDAPRRRTAAGTFDR
jgi:DNA repair exonuclease SbcCD ATPase subunit